MPSFNWRQAFPKVSSHHMSPSFRVMAAFSFSGFCCEETGFSFSVFSCCGGVGFSFWDFSVGFSFWDFSCGGGVGFSFWDFSCGGAGFSFLSADFLTGFSPSLSLVARLLGLDVWTGV